MEQRISIVTLGVKDLKKAFQFYHHGLGFSAKGNPEEGIIFLKTSFTCLALYPIEKLAADIGVRANKSSNGFSGMTLAHNVREKKQVKAILSLAEQSGGKIVKPAQDTFWGGHSGYFSDPDGYFWEVAWGAFDFREDGSLIIE